MAVSTGLVRPQVKILGLLSSGHFMSHYYSMVLPPLFPFMHDSLGISYAALGLLLSIKHITAGVLQLPAGILVDRLGAKLVLLFGLFMCAAGLGLIGFADSYWVLVAMVVVIGIGNSVFHPADYSIMDSTMDSGYMGRSFSVHTFAGHLGSAIAPLVVIAVAGIWGWRMAFVVSGVAGLVVLVGFITQWNIFDDNIALAEAKKRGKDKAATTGVGRVYTTWQLISHILKSPPILFLFLFFAMSSMANGGLRSFAVAGLVALHNTPVAAAGGALTGFLFASAFGVLVGGLFADKTKRHDLIAACGLIVSAVIVLIVGEVNLHYTLLVFAFSSAGLISGVIRPARDMMIRSVSPQGSMGKVFGFVFSGQSIGGGIAPVIYGYLIDIGQAVWIFYTSAIFMLLCMGVVLLSGRSARRHAEAATDGLKG